MESAAAAKPAKPELTPLSACKQAAEILGRLPVGDHETVLTRLHQAEGILLRAIQSEEARTAEATSAVDLVRCAFNTFSPQLERSPAFRDCLDAFGHRANFDFFMAGARILLNAPRPCTCNRDHVNDDEHAPWCGGPPPADPVPAGDDLDHGQTVPDATRRTQPHYTDPRSEGVQATAAQPQFSEAECGGAFDGNQVTSDADPGL